MVVQPFATRGKRSQVTGATIDLGVHSVNVPVARRTDAVLAKLNVVVLGDVVCRESAHCNCAEF